eukprot:1155555-Pelagomonas_calceolata.AAC.1
MHMTAAQIGPLKSGPGGGNGATGILENSAVLGVLRAATDKVSLHSQGNYTEGLFCVSRSQEPGAASAVLRARASCCCLLCCLHSHARKVAASAAAVCTAAFMSMACKAAAAGPLLPLESSLCLDICVVCTAAAKGACRLFYTDIKREQNKRELQIQAGKRQLDARALVAFRHHTAAMPFITMLQCLHIQATALLPLQSHAVIKRRADARAQSPAAVKRQAGAKAQVVRQQQQQQEQRDAATSGSSSSSSASSNGSLSSRDRSSSSKEEEDGKGKEGGSNMSEDSKPNDAGEGGPSKRAN